MRRKTIALLVFLFWGICLHAFTPNFKKLSTNDGISQSEVYCFTKGKSNFIWFGTIHGLNRFDGYEVKTYNIEHDSDKSLMNNTIHTLVEDGYNRLWIGTNDGLNVFLQEEARFIKVKLPVSESEFKVKQLVRHSSNLLIGTTVGLFALDLSLENLHEVERSAHQVQIRKNNLELNSSAISDLYLCQDESLWIAYYDSLVHVKLDENCQFGLPYPEAESFNRFCVQSIYEDVEGNIWLGQSNALLRYDKNRKMSTFLKGTDISDIVSDSKGNLWIGSSETGLYGIEASELLLEHPYIKHYKNDIYDNNSISSNMIYSLYVSSDDILWVGTIGSGINYLDLNQKEFNYYVMKTDNDDSSRPVNFVRSVNLTPENDIMIGLHLDGLHLINRKNGNTVQKQFPKESVFHIYHLDHWNYLICTSRALYYYDLKGDTKTILLNRPFFYVTEGADDILWACSSGGIYRLKLDGTQLVSIDLYNQSSFPELSYQNCRVAVYDTLRNSVWVGEEGGFDQLILDKNGYPTSSRSFTTNDAFPRISNKYVRSLCFQNDSTLWVGTFNGLNCLKITLKNEVSIKSYFKEDGLPNNVIQSIVNDRENRLWIGTNGGLSRLDTSKIKFWNFSYVDGIQSNEFSEHASFVAPDGEIFLGGINGLTSFYPEKIRPARNKEHITLTEISVLNHNLQPGEMINDHVILEKPIHYTSKINLSPRENSISLKFSAMIYASAEKCRYRYKLVGYDEQWKETKANHREASYTNLPYGDYDFLVKVSDGDGNWSDQTKLLSIHIDTPLLLKTPALITYVVIFICLVFLIMRYTILKETRRKKNKLEEDHMKRLHQLDMIRTQFFINISHDLRTPLTLILSPLGKILKSERMDNEERNHLIRRAFNSAERLHYLIEQLLDFRVVEPGKEKLHLNRVNLNSWLKNEVEFFSPSIVEKGLELRYNMSFVDREVVMDCRKMSKVIFNLLSNAIKFTDEGFIEICTHIDDERISIEVVDSGVGIPEDKISKIFDRYYSEDVRGYGIGLSHCKALLESMGAECYVTSTLGKGSCFKICFISDTTATCEDLEQFKVHKDVPSVQDNHNSSFNPELQTILVVDDNFEMRQYIMECLAEKYNVVQASNAMDAFDFLKNSSIDLILSDVMMPQIDGIEFCHLIRNDVNVSDLPIILLTAKTDPHSYLEGLKEGADDYISKPFSEELLLARIENLLHNREILKKAFHASVEFNVSKISIRSTDEQFMNKLLLLLDTHISNPDLSMEFIEEEMAMSHSSFFRKIKRLTGLSGKEFLQEMRMKRSFQLIKDTDLRMNEIAFMVGFTDYKYFSKCFKEHFGKSPSSYR